MEKNRDHSYLIKQHLHIFNTITNKDTHNQIFRRNTFAPRPITQFLKNLEDTGLITKTKDGHKKTIHLTKKGKKLQKLTKELIRIIKEAQCHETQQ